MFDIVGRRSFETSVLAGLLFYAFANPSTFKMVKKIPGLNFVMKGTSEITHSGVLTHALVFGVALFFVCWFINATTLREYVHVVEGLENAGQTPEHPLPSPGKPIHGDLDADEHDPDDMLN